MEVIHLITGLEKDETPSRRIRRYQNKDLMP